MRRCIALKLFIDTWGSLALRDRHESQLAQAQESMNLLIEGAHVGQIVLEWIRLERFEMTQMLRQKFHDKPHISFTDLTSMVVMNDMSISTILTGDAHVTHVGFGFQLVP